MTQKSSDNRFEQFFTSVEKNRAVEKRKKFGESCLWVTLVVLSLALVVGQVVVAFRLLS